jgi:hypothetical protein
MRSFADAYRAAIQRCGPQQDRIRESLQELLQGVEEELQLHESYAQVGGACRSWKHLTVVGMLR